MTKLFINSTDPSLAARMKPEVFDKILQRRLAVKGALKNRLSNANTITLEIGSGHGHFLVAYGENHPNELCVGIDVNRGRVYKAIKKADRANLVNVFFFEIDSLEFLALLPAHIRLSKTWILFPDPWPKKRHLKNRIVQDHFLKKLASLTMPAGRIFIRSDYEPYLEWSRELIGLSGDWQLLENYVWPDLPTTVFQELTDNCHFSLAAELKPLE